MHNDTSPISKLDINKILPCGLENAQLILKLLPIITSNKNGIQLRKHFVEVLKLFVDILVIKVLCYCGTNMFEMQFCHVKMNMVALSYTELSW